MNILLSLILGFIVGVFYGTKREKPWQDLKNYIIYGYTKIWDTYFSLRTKRQDSCKDAKPTVENLRKGL